MKAGLVPSRHIGGPDAAGRRRMMRKTDHKISYYWKGFLMVHGTWMRLHASLIVMAMAASGSMASAQSDHAAGKPADAQPNNADIVVTGTKIKGVAPIGSNLVSVGRDVIEKTAPVNVSQLVNTVPSITTSGAASQGENAYSYYSPQIHSLAGSSSNTTLVIVDGLRLPGGGTQFAQTDPNIIPVSAIQRVEVLADGASSVYGSDAVAGVVNFITRKTFDGFEANVQGGVADHYDNKNISFIWGKKWATGGVYLAGSWSQQSNLLNKDRSFSSMGDYTPIGGTNTNSYQCPAATMSVPGVSGVYLSPHATTTVANSQANAPCNNSVYATLLPSQGRGNVMIKMVNDFSDRISATYMLNYNRQKTNSPNGPGGLSSVTVYGPGSGKGDRSTPSSRRPPDRPEPPRKASTGWRCGLTAITATPKASRIRSIQLR
jgi:iron complex outermembrane receptor protein